MRVLPPRYRRAVFLLPLLALSACRAPLSSLNQLAASGSIDEQAPVVARRQLQINAPPDRVWSLLTHAAAWPAWNHDIDRVDVPGPLTLHTGFTWTSGGLTTRSQVQLAEPDARLAWTGTLLSARAVHVWTLTAQPGNRTLVSVAESLDGPLLSVLFPSPKLAAAETAWLTALEAAAQHETTSLSARRPRAIP